MKALVCLFFYFGLVLLAFGDSSAAASAPIKKFRLPQYNDAGFRSGLLEGDEARLINLTRIDISEMHFTTFSGNESNTLDMTMLAPAATIRIPDTKHISVESKGPVRVIRDDLDASGNDWTFNLAEKKLSMRQNVHVVFRAELTNILQ